MRGTADFLLQNWHTLVIPLSVLGITLLAGLILRRPVFNALERWAGRTQWRVDDLLLESFRRPFMLWVLILGVHLAAQASRLPPRPATLIARFLLVLWIVSITDVLSRLAGRIVRVYGNNVYSALPVNSLSQNVARLVVVAVGALLLLNTLGVSITPILTALGVGGLAVALALQETLANFFAGFYISVANQIRIGDYIKLDSGEEGYVADINWRNSTIRTLPNNLVIIPNSKLAQAIITNFHLPEQRMSLLIPIGVSYDSDPDTIERILTDQAKAAAGEIPGLLAEPAPSVRFIPGFGDSSLNFTLICQVKEFTDQYLVQHELRKRIFRAFRQSGIEIPYPIRTVYLRPEANGEGRAATSKPAGAHG